MYSSTFQLGRPCLPITTCNVLELLQLPGSLKESLPTGMLHDSCRALNPWCGRMLATCLFATACLVGVTECTLHLPYSLLPLQLDDVVPVLPKRCTGHPNAVAPSCVPAATACRPGQASSCQHPSETGTDDCSIMQRSAPEALLQDPTAWPIARLDLPERQSLVSCDTINVVLCLHQNCLCPSVHHVQRSACARSFLQ